MTNKEAIQVLKSTPVNLGRRGGKTVYAEALEMAIEALRAQDVTDTNVGNNSDTIYRQDAIDVVKRLMGDYELSRTVQTGLHILPSAQPETCDTCKHGYFGDEQCNDCRVRFTSHYERRTDEC